MWKWMFQKVIKVRERVAVDLGGADAEKPFLEHLEDLRTMIVRMAITLCVTVVGTFFFSKQIIALLTYPIHLAKLDDKIQLIGIGITDAFMVQVNASMMAGIILSFPLLLYFLMQFVLPGLKHTEKRILFPALGIGVGLFMTGVLFAYFVVSPGTIYFFYSCNADLNIGVDMSKPIPMSIVTYNKFITQFVLIFGACFETPVLVMALVKMDILSYKIMKTTRSYAVVAIAILAAVVTPTQDALTLGLLAVPMYALYEICIWLAWWMEKKDRAANPEYYKGLDSDEKAMEAEGAEWDNADYNPWSTATEDEKDEELTPKKPVAPTVPMDPAHIPHTPDAEHPAPPPVDHHLGDKPDADKTLEDFSREDEKRNQD
ncbi:MAG: twin-arginine translocase subunit TatC [Verrucomicrobiaceae bacterium]|nr:twin-arginine translocase subunit TatC [Verrucomicrobiaceae bacterium]